MSNFVNLTCKKATIMCFIRNQGKQPKFYKTFILCGQILNREQCRIYLTWTAFLLHFINNVTVLAYMHLM